MINIRILPSRIISSFLHKLSSTITPAPVISADISNTKVDQISENKPKSSLVTAAFDLLKSENAKTIKNEKSNFMQSNTISESIINAQTVSDLLTLAQNNSLSRKQALQIVSMLAEWSSIKRVKLTDFENDPRFNKLCRLLGRTPLKSDKNFDIKQSNKKILTEDLNTVLSIAGDDEAAKLVASLNSSQMVRVMKALAQKKRRSTPLLRSLAYNLSSSQDCLNLKECSDVLYAMASLSFPDSVLAAKVCADIQMDLIKNKDKPAAIGSILTSLGLLKYRDEDVLESLLNWVLKNKNICRPQDICSLFLTMAILNFKPENMEEIKDNLVTMLTFNDVKKPSDWLSYIWSLSLLGICSLKHLESALGNDFIEKLKTQTGDFCYTHKIKVLNINAYAQLIADNYKGPFLSADSLLFDVNLTPKKEKEILLNGILDALKSLFPAKTHIKSLQDTKMGFLVDILCVLDQKCNPLPVDKKHINAIRVAIMPIDFHDMCHGPHKDVCGIMNMNFQLLEKTGYKVLPVPYNEFCTNEKMLKRVQYLEKKLKALVKSN